MIARDPSGKTKPSKIAGLVYVLFGVFALFVGMFVLIVGSTLGGLSTQVRYIFSGVLLAYGIFRIVSGFSTIRKADAHSRSITLRGNDPSVDTTNSRRL